MSITNLLQDTTAISAHESLPKEKFSLKEECAVQIQNQGDKGGQKAICGKRLSEL